MKESRLRNRMMNQCPKCEHQRIIKSGFVKGKQRYKCKSCNYQFTQA
ncbi:MAG: transposase, partial [Snowella sp.]|nr:transposase [Snowella sp.]